MVNSKYNNNIRVVFLNQTQYLPYRHMFVCEAWCRCFTFNKKLCNVLNGTGPSGLTTVKFDPNNVINQRGSKRHKKVNNYLYEIHNHDPMKNNVINTHYGTTKLEESIPFEYDKKNDVFHGPYLFAVPIKKFSDEINNISLATVINNSVLSESFNHLKLDLIIGIDNGGDSLTCGIDYHNDPKLARDIQVLHSMKNNLYNIPYIHYVFAPGSDGESTIQQLKSSRLNKDYNYLGQFKFNKELIQIMREKTKYLTDTRTSNIIYSAFINDKQDMVTIPRGRKPRIQIPRIWLISCWVFSTSF